MHTHSHTHTHTHTQTEDDATFQVVTMVATGKKLFVGTTGGTVGVFDSESGQLLNAFSWHKDKVRTLLVMPKEMEPCVCNEIPFPDQEAKQVRSTSVPTQTLHPHATEPSGAGRSPMQRGISAFSYFDNHHYIRNPEPDAVMITSVGNGRRRYLVNEQTKEDRVKMFDTEVERRNTNQRSLKVDRHNKHGEDIVLLTWRS